MKKLEKVILCQKSRLGEQYEVKNLKRGFVRFLLPRKEILLYNEKNLSWVEDQKKKKEKENLLLEEKAQELAEKLSNFTLTFTLKKNEKGEPLGSVSFKEILQKCEQNGFHLEKNQLLDFHSLNKFGENIIKVKLINNFIANLKIIIN